MLKYFLMLLKWICWDKFGGSDIRLTTAICVNLDCTYRPCGHVMVREEGRIICSKQVPILASNSPLSKDRNKEPKCCPLWLDILDPKSVVFANKRLNQEFASLTDTGTLSEAVQCCYRCGWAVKSMSCLLRRYSIWAQTASTEAWSQQDDRQNCRNHTGHGRGGPRTDREQT
jgi:hypothetical protein